MGKKLKKVIIFIVIMILQFQINVSYVFADASSSPSEGNAPGRAVINPDQYDPSKQKKDQENETAIQKKLEKIAGAVNVLGVVISIIIIMVIGIKFMIASVEEKAEYKKAMTGYLLGAFMVMAITTIPSIIYNVMKSM